MALVDADMRFIYVDVGRNGRMNDSGVWGSCDLRQEIEENACALPPPRPLRGSDTAAPFVIVGDEGFGLKSYLMRPYSVKDGLTESSRIFDYRYKALISRWSCIYRVSQISANKMSNTNCR